MRTLKNCIRIAFTDKLIRPIWLSATLAVLAMGAMIAISACGSTPRHHLSGAQARQRKAAHVLGRLDVVGRYHSMFLLSSGLGTDGDAIPPRDFVTVCSTIGEKLDTFSTDFNSDAYVEYAYVYCGASRK